MRSYGLRQSIRCPKKYGETIKERKNMLGPRHDLDFNNEQSVEDPQKPLDDRHIKNAAVLPDLKVPLSDRTKSTEGRTASSMSAGETGPLIHGFTVQEYQLTYHSVVDPLLFSLYGKPTAYSLELGRNIKEHLFRELAYPTLQISEQPSGKVDVVERFCVLRPTPFIDIDSKGEPQ
ncbi:uncharacterized protein C22orf31-like isoform X2 [Anabas testudineus]|nr:uncharacterized protein C22orf31-like isoform X2 [Anabas testudineus]